MIAVLISPEITEVNVERTAALFAQSVQPGFNRRGDDHFGLVSPQTVQLALDAVKKQIIPHEKNTSVGHSVPEEVFCFSSR